MGDDANVRIFAKLDDILQRITKVETIVEENKKHRAGIEKDVGELRKSVSDQGIRIGKLEQAKAGAVAIREFIAWGAAILACSWGLMK